MKSKSLTLLKAAALVATAALSLSAHAGGTFVPVYSFPAPTDTSATSPGSWPMWDLTLDSSTGLLVGVTANGGTGGGGALYTVRTDGLVNTLRSFGTNGDTQGGRPNGPVLVTGSGYYGVTQFGGANGKGVLYKWSTVSGYQVLYHFGTGTEGANPSGPLLLASNGNVYGTATNGGACGVGTVFQFSLSNPGSVSTTHSFCGSEGTGPMTGVIQASDGKLYGTAYNGGDSNGGTLFSIDPANNGFSRLYSFGAANTPDPRFPSRLIQARDGLLYGTSYAGGNGAGTIFSSTLTGAVTVRTAMQSSPSPWSALNERFIGVFYANSWGSDAGRLYQFRSSNNSLSTIHQFVFGDASWPKAGLTVGADGNLWSVTTDGESTWSGHYGTIFKIQFLTANP
ncbi:choice-of-anchor tandem repeat GloVer-containing protein [Roseateles chitinivorans]|uniref:choice-of-anchor tandem repeat GloVer-containing protein n=1 Tax=Roseateles chitinivorans TaxID=2917965 RepID=UPI003D66DEE4